MYRVLLRSLRNNSKEDDDAAVMKVDRPTKLEMALIIRRLLHVGSYYMRT